MSSYLVHCYSRDGQCEPVIRLCVNRLDALKIARDFMYEHCEDREHIRMIRERKGLQIELKDEVGPFRACVKSID